MKKTLIITLCLLICLGAYLGAANVPYTHAAAEDVAYVEDPFFYVVDSTHITFPSSDIYLYLADQYFTPTTKSKRVISLTFDNYPTVSKTWNGYSYMIDFVLSDGHLSFLAADVDPSSDDQFTFAVYFDYICKLSMFCSSPVTVYISFVFYEPTSEMGYHIFFYEGSTLINEYIFYPHTSISVLPNSLSVSMISAGNFLSQSTTPGTFSASFDSHLLMPSPFYISAPFLRETKFHPAPVIEKTITLDEPTSYSRGFSAGAAEGVAQGERTWAGLFPSFFGSVARFFTTILDIPILGTSLLTIAASIGAIVLTVVVIKFVKR